MELAMVFASLLLIFLKHSGSKSKSKNGCNQHEHTENDTTYTSLIDIK